MNTVFADAFYFFALLNDRDPAHQRALLSTQEFSGAIVTTDWIITELGDGLARSSKRNVFAEMYAHLLANPHVTIVACDRGLLNRGIQLYASRPDKEWSLTDCISFIVMQHLALPRL